METLKKFLYLVVVGGRSPKANVELHDVRWVIGSKIEDTFDQLRNAWFGSHNGLHIDSYKKIDSIDGYKINLKNTDKTKSKKTSLKKVEIPNKNLWFVNIGGYDPSSMQEKHEFGLIVASNSSEAKNRAKSKWLIDCKQKHKDDISEVDSFTDVDDCELIKKIRNWEIELIPDDSYVEEKNVPDWFGYMRIDKK
ncbi:conserved hypothetical protein [Prochlorococcus marinus str. MIT 9515]|uniref:DUF1543 domain-containing protein n=1 Tax=Prochlorococcus marinus (strain MIT 9515) TaxID=167542 RepID=A2BYC3_PROM5|nr:DUF1543 domain-containing protein [Prochlorococcus marinus]ABM72784.1 conserved hypothetical protein [Prochlorococcus marinus str. MIT 9515]